jgi:LPS-assembly protein
MVAYPGQYVGRYPAAVYPYGLAGPYRLLAPGQNPAFPASDLVAEVALTGYKHLGVNLDYQWNPYTSQTEKSEVSVQYRPDPSRVVNLGYSFQTGILKQWDGSFAWPIAQHWNTVGRWVYSLQDHQTIEQVAGFEYKSCCYKLQLVQRRYLSIRPGTTTVGGTLDTSYALQLELTGLSSVGKREDSFLEQSIRGYSTRDPNIQ